MSLFNFVLRPVAEIEPWGYAGRQTLSWFGLSDGFYWLELDGQELFRVREAPPGSAPPYVDYQVVRLWEDLLDIVPAVLEPVPPDIAHWLGEPERFVGTIERLWEDESLDEPAANQRLSEGLAFWHARCLTSSHLVAAPDLWLWRAGDTLYALWRSHKAGAEHWLPAAGRLAMPVERFVAELRRFDGAFLAAMGERVRDLRRCGGVAGVEIDLDHLEKEQRDRSLWLERALLRTPATNWEPARLLLAHLSRSAVIP